MPRFGRKPLAWRRPVWNNSRGKTRRNRGIGMRCSSPSFVNRINVQALALLLMSLSASSHADSPPARSDFETAIVPILVKNCVSCHNAGEAKGGLDLTRKESLLKGGKSGPAI